MSHGNQDGVIAYNPDSWADQQQLSGTHYRRVFDYRAGAAIAQGDLLYIDVADATGIRGLTVIPTPSAPAIGTNAQGVVGVALHAAADGQRVRVATGLVLVKAATDVAAGNALTTAASAAGTVGNATVGTHHVIGQALADDGAAPAAAGQVWARLYTTL